MQKWPVFIFQEAGQEAGRLLLISHKMRLLFFLLGPVQSVRRKRKTKTRFRFSFFDLLHPIGKWRMIKNKNAFLFLTWISPSNWSNRNQKWETMPDVIVSLYYISTTPYPAKKIVQGPTLSSNLYYTVYTNPPPIFFTLQKYYTECRSQCRSCRLPVQIEAITSADRGDSDIQRHQCPSLFWDHK